MVWARHTIVWTGHDCPTGNSTNRETKRQRKNGKTTSERGLASNGASYYGKLRTARSGGSWLYVSSAAPTVRQITGWVKVKLKLKLNVKVTVKVKVKAERESDGEGEAEAEAEAEANRR